MRGATKSFPPREHVTAQWVCPPPRSTAPRIHSEFVNALRACALEILWEDGIFIVSHTWQLQKIPTLSSDSTKVVSTTRTSESEERLLAHKIAVAKKICCRNKCTLVKLRGLHDPRDSASGQTFRLPQVLHERARPWLCCTHQTGAHNMQVFCVKQC